MRASIYLAWAAFAIIGAALPMFGQTSALGSGQSSEGCKDKPEGAAPTKVTQVRPQPKPYTAEFKITKVQTLGNGAKITTEMTEVRSRDSSQRTVYSNTSIQPYGDQTPTTKVNVDEPDGTRISWDSRLKKATIIQYPQREQRHGCWKTESGDFSIRYPQERGPAATARSDSSVKPALSATLSAQLQRTRPVREILGAATILGVEATGTRFTTTTPVGEIGNDQPLVSTRESWFAGDLSLELRYIDDDPRRGKTVKELVKLDLSEPDPVLFQPPEGYEVVTEEMVPCKDAVSHPQ